MVYDLATSSNPILSGVDNLAITPAGEVLVAEDGGDKLVVITPEGGPTCSTVADPGSPTLRK